MPTASCGLSIDYERNGSLKFKNSNSLNFITKLFSGLILIGLIGCGPEKRTPKTLETEDEETKSYSEELIQKLSPSLADSLQVSLWASELLIGDPVALDMDDSGRAFITVTERRRDSELDIRNHRDWMIESNTFETVEDRRDFVRSVLAPEKSEENTWMKDHNNDGSHDWKDLRVQKESVYKVEDLTGSGYADQSQEFISGFNDEISDVAGAVLYHEEELFVGVAPDLWRIRDGNGDGYGEEKESISHGYGVNIGFAGHGMSGLTVGPDGRIYWSIGDRGISVEDKEGKKWHYPREGIIVRSEPDGSDFEVFASGFRNTHEFDFDKYGNLITVDNDGDHSGEFERLLYVVNGSDSGWRLNWQYGKYNDPLNNDYKVLMEEEYYKPHFEGQAAHFLPPLSRYHDGPAGMAYNPGTALGDEWKDHFFVAKFVGSASSSAIHAFTLKEKGASFELNKDMEVMKGILATGLDFGPDGALYFADWVEGWALNQQGRIWKLDAVTEKTEKQSETEEILSEDFSDHSADELFDHLSNEDMRIRKKAQFELASREDLETLHQALDQKKPQLTRIHGIWGLAQIARKNSEVAEDIVPLLTDDDSEIQAQAAKMLGDVRFEPAADELIPLLKDENARVKFFATEALGRIASQEAFDPIVEMLESNDEKDVYLRHAGAIALERIGDERALGNLSKHPSTAVRIAAVVALKRLKSPEVIPFLQDEDEFVATNAARAINDDGTIEEGLTPLAEMVEQEKFSHEPLLRRAINANLYHGREEDARRLASFSLREDVSEALRIEALKTLSVWTGSSVLDRVTGEPKGKVENSLKDAHAAIKPFIPDILNSDDADLRVTGLETLSSLKYTEAASQIMAKLSEDPSAAVRIASLDALAEMGSDDIKDAVFTALEDTDQEVRMNALSLIPDLDLTGESIVELIEPVVEEGTVKEQKTAINTLGQIDHPNAYRLLEEHLQQLRYGKLNQNVQLELVQAAERVNSERVSKQLQDYQNEKSNGDSAAVYSESLYGGDSAEGRRIFFQDESAQCIRCHVVDGEGSEVGPDLSTIGDRQSRKDLLMSLVHPNDSISAGYGSVTLTLQNGENLSGELTDETEEQITVKSGGVKQTIDKSEIEKRQNSASGMPAMGEILSRSELRDVVEYLYSLKGDESE